MDFPDNQQLLQSAWNELSHYRTMQCGQNHENVVGIDKINADLYERGHDDHPEWKIKIKGLCNLEMRNSILGCAHTMVLVRYNRQLERLVSEKIIQKEKLPIQEINDVVAQIYTMDHEKGKFEKELAVLKKSSAGTEEADRMTRHLKSLRGQHAELVQKLELLHQDVLSELKKEIDKTA